MKIKDNKGRVVIVPDHLVDAVKNAINSGNHSQVEDILAQGNLPLRNINIQKNSPFIPSNEFGYEAIWAHDNVGDSYPDKYIDEYKNGGKLSKAEIGISLWGDQNQTIVPSKKKQYATPPKNLQPLNIQMPEYQYAQNSTYTPAVPTGYENLTEVKDLKPFPNKGKTTLKGFSLTPLSGNKYLNRATQYLSQGLNNALAYGTKDNSYADMNWYNGSVSNPAMFQTFAPGGQVLTPYQLPYGNIGNAGLNAGVSTISNVGNAALNPTQTTPLTSQQIGQGAYDAANIAGMATNFTQSAINTGKGILDIIGSQKQNRLAQKHENELYTQSVFADAMNVLPYETQGYGFQGRNSLAANGMEIKEIGGNGSPTVEIEGQEHVLLPNGMSQEVQGASHADGGIPLNLPTGTKIFSEKLKVETPKGKKSYADLAKKFETKKNVDVLNSKTADSIQKETAKMMINKKKEKLDQLFNIQESLKMGGYHGDAIANETMNQMAEGGMMKYPNGGDTWNAQTFKTKEGIYTPKNVSLNQNPLVNWESKRQEWEKIARDSGQLKPNERFKSTKDMQEFMYDWALDNDPNLIKDMWKTFGVTNQNEASYKGKNVDNLSMQDLKDLRGNFIDNLRGKRVFSPSNPQAPQTNPQSPQIQKEIVFKDRPVETTKYVNPNVDIQGLNLGIPMPEVYGREPLNYYKIDPNYIDPRYLDIQPQLNEVNRGLRAVQNNLGSRGTSDLSTLLQAQTNAYNQQNQIYGNKYNYDRNQDASAQQFNAQAKTQADQYNQQSWFNQLEDPIRRREGAIDTQKRTDTQAEIENANKMNAFYNNKNYIDNTFFPYRNLDPQSAIDLIWNDSSYGAKTVRTTKKDGNTTTSVTEKQKFGGKVKPKLKLKIKK